MSVIHDQSPHQPPRLRTPAGPSRRDQPWWNPQRGSLMPAGRYRHNGGPVAAHADERSWPGRHTTHAPLWASVDLRDGNQALPEPMDTRRKTVMFDLLVAMGFKEIEVGYPSSSGADFDFVRSLALEDRIPDDVTISVFTPARADLIARTFDAIAGVDRAVVHLCLATACLWRDIVFRLSAAQLKRLTLESVEQVARRADAMPGSAIRFEYSPETFNVTEPDFALEVCNAVTAGWDAAPDRPVTLNLPSTVETDTPNVYADQVEWMHRNLDNRSSIILSVHPHNDRGTAVASAELAMLAGADRIEGTLFGNGERTGNVCLATLALNLFSHGIDPQLDFSDIDGIRRTVEFGSRLPVPVRHPYAGDLVYTAFSGTHQDAIAKGLQALAEEAHAQDRPADALAWQVPYLPIDPKDVGRSYESVVRVNSQSGKGGVAHLLNSAYGLNLPHALRVEFAKAVQRVTERTGTELTPQRLRDLFDREYVRPPALMSLKDYRLDHIGGQVRLAACLVLSDGRELALCGTGPDPVDVFVAQLATAGHPIRVLNMVQEAVTKPDGMTAVYVEALIGDTAVFGVGLDSSSTAAALGAILSAVNRAHHRGTVSSP